ncbi:hypothetical protein H4582DRAFT_1508119 [Lactarius indigo]|nr:hypothetical protein H4582DRAFT_1508119 [Lactarius indigo]
MWSSLGRRLAELRGLLDRLDASILSMNGLEIAPKARALASRAIPSFLLCHVRPNPSPENPICQRSNALHHPHMSGQVFSPLRTQRLPQQQLRWTSACSLALPPDRRPSTTGARNMGRRRIVSICGAGEAGSAASTEHGTHLRRAGGGPEGAARRGGEGGRGP